uniref:Putative secreted protein n=1 Tax=Ixodes ricinus TaxID=34613 RepID=A0A147BBV3_IXORI
MQGGLTLTFLLSRWWARARYNAALFAQARVATKLPILRRQEDTGASRTPTQRLATPAECCVILKSGCTHGHRSRVDCLRCSNWISSLRGPGPVIALP